MVTIVKPDITPEEREANKRAFEYTLGKVWDELEPWLVHKVTITVRED